MRSVVDKIQVRFVGHDEVVSTVLRRSVLVPVLRLTPIFSAHLLECLQRWFCYRGQGRMSQSVESLGHIPVQRAASTLED